MKAGGVRTLGPVDPAHTAVHVRGIPSPTTYMVPLESCDMEAFEHLFYKVKESSADCTSQRNKGSFTEKVRRLAL